MDAWNITIFRHLESFFIDNLLALLEKLPVENGNIGNIFGAYWYELRHHLMEYFIAWVDKAIC